MALTVGEALALGPQEVVALVGAGGKTSALFRLARELRSARSSGVAVSTTTRIYPPPPSPDLRLVLALDLESLLKAVRGALDLGMIPVVGREITADGKVRGLPPEWVESLARERGVAHVVVEADGAAGRPLTAPRAHEPVIPASATLVVPVVGSDVLGQPLHADFVHNPERVAALTGLQPGDALDACAVAVVMLDREGNCRGAPAAARVVPLVNKADSPERLAAARSIAAALLDRGAPRVVVAALGTAVPVVEVLASS